MSVSEGENSIDFKHLEDDDNKCVFVACLFHKTYTCIH